MTYYIFSESAGQNIVNERYCNIPSISNASFGHERSVSLLLNGLFAFKKSSFSYETRKFLCSPVKPNKLWVGNFTPQDIINSIIIPREVIFLCFSFGLFIKLSIAKIYLNRDHVPQASRALVPLREVFSVWGPATD